MAKLVSKVYGDALFSLAVEENRVDELWDETRAMKQVLSENPDFMAILEHPEMTMEKKMDVLQEVFQKELSQDMMGLLHVLVKKGRIGELIPVLAYFNECAMAYKKIGKVQIQTPMPLSEKQKKKIEQKLLEVSEFYAVADICQLFIPVDTVIEILFYQENIEQLHPFDGFQG